MEDLSLTGEFGCGGGFWLTCISVSEAGLGRVEFQAALRAIVGQKSRALERYHSGQYFSKEVSGLGGAPTLVSL